MKAGEIWELALSYSRQECRLAYRIEEVFLYPRELGAAQSQAQGWLQPKNLCEDAALTYRVKLTACCFPFSWPRLSAAAEGSQQFELPPRSAVQLFA